MNSSEHDRANVMECLSTETIDRLAQGASEAAHDEGALRDHVRDCERCRAALAQAQGDINLLGDIRRIVAEATAFLERATGSAAAATAFPARVAGYELVRLIGEGATAEVYEALQPMPHRSVAIKLLRQTGAAAGSCVTLLEREAAAAARLSHPNIASVFAAGLSEIGQPFIAMELVKGKPLHEHWRETPVDLRARVTLVASICDAVQHAHDRGVRHRDLKPTNVMVDESGHAKVLDFGLAKLTAAASKAEPGVVDHGESAKSDGTCGVRGTLAFMAPEQARGDEASIDHRCDIYAIGVMLFVALTDELPVSLAGLSHREAIAAICASKIHRPSTRRPDTPKELDEIVLRALAKEPGDRYQSALALGRDLRAWLQCTAAPVARPMAHRPLTWVVLLGVAACAAGVGWAIRHWETHPNDASPSGPTVESLPPSPRDAANREAAASATMALQPEWVVAGSLTEEIKIQETGLATALDDAAKADHCARLGLLHEALGNHTRAEEYGNEVIRLRGETASPFDWCRHARALAELGRLDDARRRIEESRGLLRQKPPRAAIWERYEMAMSAALVHSRAAEFDEAQVNVRRGQDLARRFTNSDVRQWADWLASRAKQGLPLPASQ